MRLGGVKNKLSLPLSVHHVSWLLLGFMFCLTESPAPAIAVASLSLKGKMLRSLLSQSQSSCGQTYFLLTSNTPLFCCLHSCSLWCSGVVERCLGQRCPKVFGQDADT